MNASRLPASPLLRCLLAFSLMVCIFVPVGLVVLVLQLRDYLMQPLPAMQSVDFAPPVVRAVSQSTEPNAPPQNVSPQNVSPQNVSPQRPVSKGNSALVSAQIVDVVAGAQQQSAEENLTQLDSMSKKLSSVASDQSVDDMATNIKSWMGLESRSSKPKAVATIEELDIDSAQLHDVARKETKAGRFEYQAVLIDAKGRTVEIKLTEAEGKETHALMQRIKANPLLEKVYRQIAMPLVDSLVQSARDQMQSSPATRATP